MDIEKFFQEYGEVCALGAPQKVEAFLRERMPAAEAEGDQWSLVSILNEAAGFFRNINRDAEAMVMADKALALVHSLGMEGSVAHGTTLLNAATAYRAAGRPRKAMALFRQSLAVLEPQVPENDSILAALYNNISALHAQQGETREALNALRKAAAILEQHAEMDNNAATVLGNLGMHLLRAHQTEEAFAALCKAEARFARAAERSGSGSFPPPQYAATLAGMAEVWHQKGDHDRSAGYYEKALAHLASTLGENRDYAITCKNYAQLLDKLGQKEKAYRLRSKADAIFQSLGMPAASPSVNRIFPLKGEVSNHKGIF